MMFGQRRVVLIEKRTGEDSAATAYALRQAGCVAVEVEQIERVQVVPAMPPSNVVNLAAVAMALVIGAVPAGLLLADRTETANLRDARIQRLENTASRLIVTPDGEVTFRLTEDEVAQMRPPTAAMTTAPTPAPAPAPQAKKK